jgi:hypothetical protein
MNLNTPKQNLTSQYDVQGNVDETMPNFTFTTWISPGAMVLSKNQLK